MTNAQFGLKENKPRGAFAEMALQLWMMLSMVSPLAVLFSSGRALYAVATSGLLPELQSNVLVVLTPDVRQDMITSLGLMGNYIIFQEKCKVLMHPRLGVGVVLRSEYTQRAANKEQ